jgi:type IV pilus assembly protein PilN
LVKHVPDGLYLKSVVQSGGGVVLSGFAQSNERVSELLRNTSQNGVWVERPELIEIKASNVGTTPRDSARVYEFSMRMKIKRPGDAATGAKSDKPKAS